MKKSELRHIIREVIKEQLDESGQTIQAAGEQTKEVKPKGLMAKRETE